MEAMAKGLITADDVIRAGACASGVYEVLTREHKHIRASMPIESVLTLLKGEEKEYAIEAAQWNGEDDRDNNGDGFCYGNGYGNGTGNGYCRHYCHGSRDGNGNNFGDGYGGNGNHFGYGDYGCGNGYGNGYGDYGYGYGYE